MALEPTDASEDLDRRSAALISIAERRRSASGFHDCGHGHDRQRNELEVKETSEGALAALVLC